MGIVELNGNLLWEFLPGSASLFESTKNIVKRSGAPKVLLLQAKFLSTFQTFQSVKLR
jgi:hypothetical protein